MAYVKAHGMASAPYRHNRLGAVFVPRRQTADELVGQVLGGSPAHDAGLRSGDRLVAIDDLDVTRWRTDPDVLPLSRFWSRPAATRLTLTYERNGQVSAATVQLRDILGRKR